MLDTRRSLSIPRKLRLARSCSSLVAQLPVSDPVSINERWRWGLGIGNQHDQDCSHHLGCKSQHPAQSLQTAALNLKMVVRTGRLAMISDCRDLCLDHHDLHTSVGAILRFQAAVQDPSHYNTCNRRDRQEKQYSCDFSFKTDYPGSRATCCSIRNCSPFSIRKLPASRYQPSTPAYTADGSGAATFHVDWNSESAG
jgi:hypothetical protein